MKTLSSFITLLIVIAIIGGIIYYSYDGIVYLTNLYATLEATTRIILLSTLATLIACAVIIASAIKNANSGTRSKPILESKLRLYSSLVEIYKPAALENRSDKNKVRQYILSNLETIESELQIIAAGPVLAQHKKLRQNLTETGKEEEFASLYQQLIKVIRRDLGHSDSQMMNKIDLLSLQKSDSQMYGTENRQVNT